MNPHKIAPLWFLSCALAILAAVFTSDRLFFYRDFWQLSYPSLQWAVATVWEGHLPLWNPYVSSGYPAFAAITSGYAYPPAWLLLILPFDFALKLYILLHLAWAGWGTYLLCRYLDFSPWPAMFAGTVFMLSGPLVSGIHPLCYLLSPSWMPWALLCYIRLHRERKMRWLLSTAGVMALMTLAGDVQTSYNTGILFVLWSLFQLRWTALLTQVSRHLGRLLAIIAIAVALASVQLLPTFELALHSERLAGVSEKHASLFSLSVASLARFFVPFLYGNPTIQWHGSGAQFMAPFVSSLYFALVPLVFVALAGFLAKDKATTRFLFTALLFFLAGSFGELPLYRWLRDWLPLWKSFRYPEKLVLPAIFCAAILSCQGLEYCLSLPRKRRVAIVCGSCGLFSSVLGAIIWQHSILLYDAGQFRYEQCTPLLFLVATMVLLLPKRSHIFAGLLCLFVAGDLVYHNRQIIPTVESQFYRADCPEALAPFQGNERFRVSFWEHSILRRDPQQTQLENARLHNGIGAGNLSTLHKVRKDLGILQTFLLPYNRLRAQAKKKSELFARFSVKRVVWKLSGDKLEYYDIAAPRPRASLVYDIITVDSEDKALKMMPFVGLDSLVVVAADAPATKLPEKSTARQQRVEIIAQTSPNEVHIETASDSPGYLLLTDNHYPGWQAFVDGKKTEIFRAELAFRAIYLPAGKHQVVFVYRPLSLYIGAGISLLALCGIGVGIFFARAIASSLPSATKSQQ